MTDAFVPPIEAGAGDDAVLIVDYDGDWPRRFASEAARLAAALGGLAIEIEHFGSTAVPGLAAKPVVDILVVVPSLEPGRPFMEAVQRLGYGHWRDLGTSDHRFCRDEQRRHHLHFYPPDSHAAREQVLFRDYLRAHPAEVAAYAQMKRAAAARFGYRRDDYSQAKSEFVGEAVRRAERWAGASGWDWSV